MTLSEGDLQPHFFRVGQGALQYLLRTRIFFGRDQRLSQIKGALYGKMLKAGTISFLGQRLQGAELFAGVSLHHSNLREVEFRYQCLLAIGGGRHHLQRLFEQESGRSKITAIEEPVTLKVQDLRDQRVVFDLARGAQRFIQVLLRLGWEANE